ncbi:MAG: CRISPR-associated endonuclease Cas2 [Thermodesulfobacteriota bacterium]
MFYLVSYDIPDDKRRLKIAKTIKDFGDRVQYSVFECILDADLLEKMVDRLGKIVEEEEDSVRIYAMCAQCEKTIQIIGKGCVTEEQDVYII